MDLDILNKLARASISVFILDSREWDIGQVENFIPSKWVDRIHGVTMVKDEYIGMFDLVAFWYGIFFVKLT